MRSGTDVLPFSISSAPVGGPALPSEVIELRTVEAQIRAALITGLELTRPVLELTTPASGLEIIMTTFAIHTIDTAPEGSRETLRHVKETLGMVPSLAAGMAESPTLLRAFFAVREIYAQGTLSPVDIQALSLANAFENNCAWCMAFHSFAGLHAGLAKDALEDLRHGRAPRDPRLRALTNLSRVMVRSRGAVSEQDLDAFYAAGFTKAQALEVVLGAAFSLMANFAGHLVDAPLGPALEPHAWTKSS